MSIIQNELYKLFQKKTTFIFLALIIFAVLVTAVIGSFAENPVADANNWKEELKQKNEQLAAENEKYKHNQILVNNNSDLIALNEYRIQNDIKPNKTLSAWSFTIESIPILSFVGLLVIIVAASIVSSEFNWGTIKLVLTRPIKRATFLFAQYMTVLIFGFICIVVLFLSSIGIGLAFFGTGDSMVQLSVANGVVSEEHVLMYLGKFYLLSTIDLLMMATFAFMLSALFRSTTLALGVALFAYLMGETVTDLLATRFDWVKYTLFANTDLSMYSTGNILIESMTLPFSIIVLAIYFVLFLSVAFISYVKRDIAM